jgi:hypothetical protein
MSIISALGRLRHQVGVQPGYIVRPGLEKKKKENKKGRIF